MATARLISPTGSTVSVDSSKVDELKRRGFTAEVSAKAASSKASGKSSK